MLNIVQIPAWVAYRATRRFVYTLRGRSGIVSGHTPSLGQEWAAVSGIVRSRSKQPIEVEPGRWNTVVGTVEAPSTSSSWYIGMMSTEISSNIYGLGREDKVVMDCGANIGLFTLQALQNGAERVISFEPSPETAVCLRRNIQNNSRVTVIEKGAWNRDEILSFATNLSGNPGSHHISESGDIRITVTTIDSVVESLRLNRLDFIKMDIEGAESKALEGAAQTVRRFHPRICVATEHTDDIYANNLGVIETMRKIEPGYDYICTESHPYQSPAAGNVMAPYTLLFTYRK